MENILVDVEQGLLHDKMAFQSKTEERQFVGIWFSTKVVKSRLTWQPALSNVPVLWI